MFSNNSDNNSANSSERATIGASISIRGEVSGSEDLLILGSVEGTVNLRENTVTVGQSARVKANISANVIHVEGEVVGDLVAREKIIVHSSGYVRGNISAPRLSLEDGARLKGAINTEPESEETSSLSPEKIRTSTPAAMAEAQRALKVQPALKPSTGANGSTPGVQ